MLSNGSPEMVAPEVGEMSQTEGSELLKAEGSGSPEVGELALEERLGGPWLQKNAKVSFLLLTSCATCGIL